MITLKTSHFFNEGGELKKSYAVFKDSILVCEFETEEEREQYLKVMNWDNHINKLKGGIKE